MAQQFTRNEITAFTTRFVESASEGISKRHAHRVIELIENSSFDRWSSMSDSEKHTVEEWIKAALPNSKPLGDQND